MFKKSLNDMALGKAISVGFLNQVITSGTNFLIVVYLVREMLKSEFGIYSIAFGMILMLSGLISSFLTIQFVVNYADKNTRNNEYIPNYFNAIAVFGFIVFLVGLIAILVLQGIVLKEESYTTIYIATFSATMAYSLREFLVRVAYSIKKEVFVLYSSALVAVMIVLGYYVLSQIPYFSLNAIEAILVLTVSYFFGHVLLLVLMKVRLSESTMTGIKLVFLEAWVGGRWNIITNLVYHVRTQIHNVVVPALIGINALADVNAARVLATPAIMAIPPIIQVIMPRLVEKKSKLGKFDRKLIVYTLGGLSGISAAYTIIIYPFLSMLIPMALGEEYNNIEALVVMWCFVAIIMAARNGMTMILQIAKKFKSLMVVNVITAFVSTLAAITLCLLFTKQGAVSALFIAEVALLLMLSRILFKEDIVAK